MEKQEYDTIAQDIADTIKLHSPNTLTLTGVQLRELTGYPVAHLAIVARDMVSKGLLKITGYTNLKDFTLAPQGHKFCEGCGEPVVPKHDLPNLGVICTHCVESRHASDAIPSLDEQANWRIDIGFNLILTGLTRELGIARERAI